jgi:hypothetical protein
MKFALVRSGLRNLKFRLKSNKSTKLFKMLQSTRQSDQRNYFLSWILTSNYKFWILNTEIKLNGLLAKLSKKTNGLKIISRMLNCKALLFLHFSR